MCGIMVSVLALLSTPYPQKFKSRTSNEQTTKSPEKDAQ